jgi:hypothetical protein
VLSLCSGGLLGILLALLASPAWGGLGVVLACGLAFPGLLWPQIIVKPYSLWNKLATVLARVARYMLLRICFSIIFVVGWSGASLQLARPTPTESLWVRRGTLAPHMYAHQYVVAAPTSNHAGWTKTYLSWARRSGNFWAVSLLPFFILLAVVDTDQRDPGFPANIYTLF